MNLHLDLLRGSEDHHSIEALFKYFKDTDTAMLEFSGQPIEETKEISENVYVDLDKEGNLVSMTIEHAAKYASLPRGSVQEIDVSTVER